MNKLKKLNFIIGTNVIESEKHVFYMLETIENKFKNFPFLDFIFKVSFDKANRTSYKSYRGLGFDKSIKIFENVKKNYDVKLLTDVHETWQVEPISNTVDYLQIPSLLCRQTDLLKEVSKFNKPIHLKKGQFTDSNTMHEARKKLRSFGHTEQIILCERGNTYGYNDIIVDPRNLIRLKSDDNLVSFDVTHCLQKPSYLDNDNVLKTSGNREYFELMGKIGIASGVDYLFMEFHDNPNSALCEKDTQMDLKYLEKYLHLFSEFI